ncbi:MAG: CPBP family glutamic-type intramembrane protease [Cyanobacteria bacterium P01_A01_bin.123]
MLSRLRRRWQQSRWYRWVVCSLAFWLMMAITVGCGAAHESDLPPAKLSKYAIASESPFNDPSYYPVSQSVDLDLYRPVAPWVGRLILPSPDQIQAEPQRLDWVWVEIYQAPPEAQTLIGQILRLEWRVTPDRQAYLDTVTRSIQFSAEAIAHQHQGNVHPERLNGWPQVGPLQSLAGARPQDDVIVALAGVTQTPRDELQIDSAPVQVPARFYGLVQVLGPEADDTEAIRAAQCPTVEPCVNEQFRVRHYNPVSRQFDGVEETVRIPQVLPASGRFQSTPADLEASPAGSDGWYIYGAQDRDGLFVVRAIAPRSLFLLDLQTAIAGEIPSLNYVNFRNWRDTPERKGSLQTVWLDPSDPKAAPDSPNWQVGDRALAIHIFGGVGGERAEPKALPGTVSGHFAYGVAEVVTDPFTQMPRFEMTYNQVYAHNPDGIVAGKISWADYMGHLQRGWLGLRPVADTLVKLEALTQDYRFGEITLSPMAELQRQLNIMMARYRTGDGTGAAIVKPAQSCVQDSSQAVVETIAQLERLVQATPEIGQWLQDHPNDVQTQRFAQLVALRELLINKLVPLGILRPDWRQNSQVLAGIRPNRDLGNQPNWLTSLLSWRTVIPRVAYDELANIFLNQGAELWILRTQQVGGVDPTIEPLAPTELLGQYVVIPTAFSRLFESLRLPGWRDWGVTLVGLGIYGAIAWPIGRWREFLQPTNPIKDLGLAPDALVRGWLKLLILPALLEEVVFRVLLLPHPTEAVQPHTLGIWLAISLALFVVYHPLNALTFYPTGKPTFFDPSFLTLAGLLGLTCSLVYLQTGSLWLPTLIHWIVVGVWVFGLGGYRRLQPIPT